LKIADQSGLDIQYSQALRRHLERVDALREGLDKAYALIFSNYCTKTMQSRIEQHPDYDMILEDDPIAVLEVIKTLMHDPVRAQYPMISMTDALCRLTNIKQWENESLLDYVRRFKELRDVAKSQLGSEFLDRFVEHQALYQNASTTKKQDEMKKEAFSQWMAYLMMRGSNQARYGSVMYGFMFQYSLGNDQYPKTITAATDALASHKESAEKRKRNNERPNNGRPKNNDGSDNATSFTQRAREVTCYCCGKKGHVAPDCDQRNKIPRNQWHVNRALQNVQDVERADEEIQNNLVDDDELTSDDESVQTSRSAPSMNRRSGSTRTRQATTRRPTSRELVPWSGLQFHQDTSCVHQDIKPWEHLKDVILLDTGSTLKATFMNPEMVTQIQESQTPISMTTNTGEKTIELEANVPGLGHTWFDPKQIANVFGFSHMADKYRITYDSDKEDAFLVHIKEGIIKFARTCDGLYAYKPSSRFKNQEKKSKTTIRQHISNMVSSVKENLMAFTKRQYENAKRARRLYTVVGRPTVPNYKSILRQNIIKNCPVTTEHVDDAEQIFGGDIGTLQGKSTQRRPTPHILHGHHVCEWVAHVNWN
jgi:hypothetical protein